MNSKPVIASLLALCFTAGSAFAQRYDRPNDRDRHEQFQRGPDRGPDFRPGPPDNRGRAHADRRGDWRGAGPRHDLHRGERLPVYYRGRQYVVTDWRLHRLSPPPRGYYWVQVGADYVLVTATTGVIVQLVLQ